MEKKTTPNLYKEALKKYEEAAHEKKVAVLSFIPFQRSLPWPLYVLIHIIIYIYIYTHAQTEKEGSVSYGWTNLSRKISSGGLLFFKINIVFFLSASFRFFSLFAGKGKKVSLLVPF